MTLFSRKAACAVCLLFSFLAQLHAQPSYSQFVAVPNVESKFINGEYRFCERANVRGLLCGQDGRFFGKKQFVVRDWWSPETYVQAYTQRMDVTVLGIQPTGDGAGVVISYKLNSY